MNIGKQSEMSKRDLHNIMTWISVLLCLSILTGCACRPRGTYFNAGIAQYRGEGRITDTSERSGFVSTRGYLVEFPRFDLGRSYDHKFRLINLPTIEGKEVQIRFVVEDETLEQNKKTLDSRASVSLTDSAGNLVTEFSSKIGSLVWSSPVHGHTGYALYDSKHSLFIPRPNETYVLHIIYAPDVSLVSKSGYVYLYSGCRGP